LHIVSLDNVLGDVDRVSVPPEYRALRPGLRGIDDKRESVFLRILHHKRRHLLKDPAGNLLLLIANLFLGILHGAVKKLLLALNLFPQVSRGIFIQL